MQPAAAPPIPANVITGPLGSGKTTIIARLLADKPPEDNWVVLLNEYSEAGIDALTVAAAARGAYDVRLIPGGCLCCTGEDDFRRNLRRIVTEVRPARVIVEPSGIGHPAGIVEELLAHEAAGELRLEAIVSLVDPARVTAALAGADDLLRDQIDIGDALVLSKADLATRAQVDAFDALVARANPAKAWSGRSVGGVLPRAALEAGTGAERRAPSSMSPPEPHRTSPHRADAAYPIRGRHAHDGDRVALPGGERRVLWHLGQAGATWQFDRAVCFDETRLQRLLGDATRDCARFKAVVRVAEDRWLLVQHAGGPLTLRDSSWRRDSRVELIARVGQEVDWSAIDAALAAAAVTHR